MEDAVLHIVLLPKENFRRDEVVRVRKRSSTSVFLPKKNPIFKLSKKKLIFRLLKVRTMKS